MKGLIRWIAVIAIIGLVFVLVWPLSQRRSTAPVPELPASPLKHKTIVIDAGHGGIDGGTHDGQGFMEKDVTLDIALKLRARLRELGANATVTRDGDHDLSGVATSTRGRHARDLKARVAMIDQLQPDFFISIHVNSSRSPDPAGAIAYYSPRDWENERLAGIVQNAMNEMAAPSAGLNKLTGGKPVQANMYYLLKEATRPGCIIEVGFMTNPAERAKLKTQEYRQQIATTLVGALEKYIEGAPQPIPIEHIPEPAAPVHKANEMLVYFPAPADGGMRWQVEKVIKPALTPGVSADSPAAVEQMAQRALEALIAGPSKPPAEIPIPPRTQVKVRLVQGRLTVSLSHHAQDLASMLQETMAVEAILKTLEQFEQIKDVQILINDEHLPTLAGHVKIDEPLPLR